MYFFQCNNGLLVLTYYGLKITRLFGAHRNRGDESAYNAVKYGAI